MATAARSRRWLIGLGIAAVVLAVAGFAAFNFAVAALRTQVEQALGPRGEVGAIRVSAGGVEILDLRIRALPRPAGKAGDHWPAEDELLARRIVVTPDWRDLLSARVRLSAIVVEGGYLSVLRTRNGKLRVLPALLEQPAGDAPSATPEITIGEIRLVDCSLDFFDATVRQPPLRLRLQQVRASLADVHLPDLKGRTKLQLDATLKGSHHDGRVSVGGWAEFASKDSEIALQLRSVDLVGLQPYLIKAAETGVRKGTLDLDVKSTVRANRLTAPGTLNLSGLELSGGGSFMGMPRAAVVSMMKDRNGRIAVKFVLDGKLDDPKFSLNESFATRVGSSVAETLGISLESLARGVGSAGRGIGEAVGKLFGN